jgi:hypothetical protein
MMQLRCGQPANPPSSRAFHLNMQAAMKISTLAHKQDSIEHRIDCDNDELS